MNPALRKIQVTSVLLNKYKTLLWYSEGSDRMEGERMTLAQVLSNLGRGVVFEGDCSSTITEIDKWSGLSDPNGLGFDGYGYTGTMLDHLPRTDTVRTGAIGIFGAYPGLHAIMALEDYKGDSTKVWSHGALHGAITTLGDIEEGFIGVPLTWLSVERLLPAVPKSYHYERFDNTVIPLPMSNNSERAVVENYDKFRSHPVLHAVQLRGIHKNLIALHKRVVNNSKHPPGPNVDYRHWREGQLALRVAGKVVKPS